MAERTGFPTLGVLKPGAAADVIVMDYKPFTPFSDANIDGHMLFGMTGRQCQTTMINGKILMRDRVLTEIDEEAVNAHILGVVMNGYNGKQSGRRDGYSYAYSYSYYDEDKKGNDA